MQLSDKLGIIEAILFACGEPISSERLAQSAQVEEQELVKLINVLNDNYNERSSAVEVIRLDDSFQLVTKKEFAPYIKAALETKKNVALSQAAMEALTIIAYNQPVTRSFIDDVRGVDSGGVVTNLIEKELIEEAGRLDIPGKPILFRTTDNFLRCFGLSSINDLVPLPKDEEQISFDDVKD